MIVRAATGALKAFARAMVAVLLATTLAPTFGWDAHIAQTVPGDHAAGIPDAHHDDDDAPDHGRAGASHDHHGCAGHMLGHLVAAPNERGHPSLPAASHAAAVQRTRCTPSQFPKRLDRPPQAACLA